MKMHLCEGCGERVRPVSEPGVVCATALDPGGGFNIGPSAPSKRGPVFFHPWCYPSRTGRYPQRPMPEGIDYGDD